MSNLDKFTLAYIMAALWSSTDDMGYPLDDEFNKEDLAPVTLQKMLQDCVDFQTKNKALLNQAGDSEQNGHDFWLSRNGHGAGFFDRDYPKEVRNALQTAAKHTGEINLYVGDDHKIYS